ncbi:hypothetical protein D3C86_1782440 [compost metagenome]
MPIISTYRARCIRCDRPVCQAGGFGRIAGVLLSRRPSRRSQTKANSAMPSMKCQCLSPSRISLPRTKLPLSSMQAYTAAISSSMSQCRAMLREL